MIAHGSEAEQGACPNEEVARWVKGLPPLNRILLIWNGTAMFGPIAFQTEAHRKTNLDIVASAPGGPATHYLVIPRCS